MRATIRWCARGSVLVLLAFPACGPVTGGRLLADERVLRAIRLHYDAHARERVDCGEPFMTRIRSGRVVDDAIFGGSTRVAIDYDWEAPAVTPDGLHCSGQGRRIFAVMRTSNGPVVTAMSGPGR